MAKLKKTVRAKAAGGSKKQDDLQAKAEQMSRSLVESAQQIWMAGVGAFNRAQGEGSKMFEALVAEGMTIEKTTRKLATGKVDAVRDVVEERVQRALNRLGVPGRDELADLIARVDTLTGELKKSGKAAVKKAAKPVKAVKRSPKKAAAPVKKAAKAVRKSLPKAAKPVAPKA